MKDVLKWLFIESHAKWLSYILVVEYFIATNLSPSFLSDSALLTVFVEKMSFIKGVHAFDSIAIHPEAVSFYIALAFVLLIPKSICMYYFLTKNPYSEMSQYVITPYTKTKPKRTLRAGEVLTEEEAKQFPTVERSMLSRIFWSVMILLMAAGMLFMNVELGRVSELLVTQKVQRAIAAGGVPMWFSLSVCRLTVSALLVAVSFFIIKDYYRLFRALINRVRLD